MSIAGIQILWDRPQLTKKLYFLQGGQEAVRQHHEPLRGADRPGHDIPVDADPGLVGGGVQVPEAGRTLEDHPPGRRPQVHTYETYLFLREVH